MHCREHILDVTLPSTSVTMLIAQPFVEFHLPRQEPFPLSQACRDRMMGGIDKVFQLARTVRPHFIVFPEFSVPGLTGVQRIRQHISSPNVLQPLIVIAGISGLSQQEYTSLCEIQGVAAPEAAIAPAAIPTTHWVDTSVTFVKNSSGQTAAWVQPKVSPAWPEANSHHLHMFQGSVIRVFRAKFDNDVPCRFLSVLCFDWIGRENGADVPEMLLNQLNTTYRAAGAQTSVQWVFVLQYNEQPNHPTFLNSTTAFLTNTTGHPFVQRHDTAVVMACTASSRLPARGGAAFGYSSLIFSPRAPFETKACPPTFATQPSRLRNTTTLGTCKDALFREMGECIHGADIRIPNFVVPNPTDRTTAIVQASVYSWSGATTDPRIPDCGVPAVVKWANDELDNLPDISTYFANTALEGHFTISQSQTVGAYRVLPSQELAIRIDESCASRASKPQSGQDPAADVDTIWDTDERAGLRHIVQTLTLIGIAVDLDKIGAQLHARHQANGVEIMAISGSTHGECVKAFQHAAARTHAPIVLITRDEHNTRLLPREVESFADPRQGAGVRFMDSQTLFDAGRTTALPEYSQFVTELLSVKDRPII
jgi:hypothetical protein